MRIFYSLLFTCVLLQLQAQPPMPFPQNAEWTVISWAHSGPGYGPYYWLYGSYGITGDTTIQGQVYSKISFTEGGLFDPLQNEYHAAIREEEGQWSCVQANELSHHLILDFSAAIGDTVVIDNPFWPDFMPLELVVSDINETMVPGRRVWIVNQLDGIWFDHWVEGIGSIQGLLEFENVGFWDAGTRLACFFEDGDITYQGYPDYDCISPLVIPFMERSEEKIVLLPNPAVNRVMIEGVYAKEVAVLDPHGRAVRLIFNSQEIMISDLHAGIYFLRIIDQEHRVHTMRLIVEN